jgi:hypothetical protein
MIRNARTAAFIAAIFLLASCLRQRLNYQSSHDSGYQTPDNNTAPQDNAGSDNYSTGSINYAAPTDQTFYDALSPYGNWVNYPVYGYAWSPNAGPGFAPYATNGSWAYTEYGMTWNSGYSWGWAPFHYGSWTYDAMYGWLWIPGNQWAPAWVNWGQYGGNYGWAPMGPGYGYNSGYMPPQNYWTFVPAQQITQPNVYSYAVANNTVVNSNINIINNSNTYAQHNYYSGPPLQEVQHVTGTQITAVKVVETPSPVAASGSGSQLNIYRPVIKTNPGVKAAPVKVTPLENLQQVSKSGTAPQASGSWQPVKSTNPGNGPSKAYQKYYGLQNTNNTNNSNTKTGQQTNKKTKTQPRQQPKPQPANQQPQKTGGK